LAFAFLFVAIIAELSQFVFSPFEVTAGDIVEEEVWSGIFLGISQRKEVLPRFAFMLARTVFIGLF
jgi:hypothetical protein